MAFGIATLTAIRAARVATLSLHLLIYRSGTVSGLSMGSRRPRGRCHCSLAIAVCHPATRRSKHPLRGNLSAPFPQIFDRPKTRLAVAGRSDHTFSFAGVARFGTPGECEPTAARRLAPCPDSMIIPMMAQHRYRSSGKSE